MSIEAICGAMHRYYSSLGRGDDYKNEEGVGKFAEYCEENGIEDDALEDELENEADECLLVDFDEDGFPFRHEPSNKKKSILDLIRKCKENPSMEFGFALPEFNQQTFDDIEPSEINEIKNLYKKQCPVIYNQGLDIDGGLCKLLAIQKKIGLDYLAHLVDSYDRWRIEHKEKTWTPEQWAMHQENKHFKKLPFRTIKVGLPAADGKKSQTVDYFRFAASCVSSFGHRCCNKLLLNSNYKINDSIEQTVKVIDAVIRFIAGKVKLHGENICPFAFDVCLAIGEPLEISTAPNKKEEGSDSDDESEDDDDYKKNEKFTDYLGEKKQIQEKLKKNKLKYLYQPGDHFKNGRTVDELINKFKNQNDIKEVKPKNYLHCKRLIALIDRRKSKDGNNVDDVYLYEPPNGGFTQHIANDAVPEWYVSAARTCLLPPMKYDEKAAIADPNTDEIDDSQKNVDNTNIGAAFHCKGGLLTMSFHAKQTKVIKAYLYYNGQTIRFLPSDIKTVFPCLFNMNSKKYNNKTYIKDKSGELEELIKEMTQILKDEQFEAWQQAFT